MRFDAAEFRFWAALQCLLTCLTLIVWQATASPSSVHAETEKKPYRHMMLLLSLPNYLWMMAEWSMVGLLIEVIDRKISIPRLHLNPSVDAASLSNLSRCNIRLRGDLKLYLLKKSVGTRRPLSTLAVFNFVTLLTQWYRTKRGLFRIMLRDRCFWNPHGRNARKATGVAFWIGIW
jgi:hypothetical protein